MSLKSLGTSALGLLKQGVKRTLEIASLGLLQTVYDPEPPKPPPEGSGNFVKSGISLTNFKKFNIQSNNTIILLSETGVF